MIDAFFMCQFFPPSSIVRAILLPIFRPSSFVHCKAILSPPLSSIPLFFHCGPPATVPCGSPQGL